MGEAMDRSSGDVVKRLLGPAESELLCDECFEKLDEYVDLELRGAAADQQLPGMRPHLDGCPACREEYDSLRELAQAEDER
jgi:hypothetical protein